MNSRLYWLIVVLMLGTIAVAACAQRFSAGTYEPDHKRDADWVRYNADGTYVIGIMPREIPGHYVLDSDKIVLNEDSGICLNHPGTYHWEIHGNVLTLQAINDTCTASEREKDSTGRFWILQP